jgi:hypothetical protein
MNFTHVNSYSDEGDGLESAGSPPRGASRLIVVTDESGNQALRLVPEDRCIFVMYQPLVGEESVRRAVKDCFAQIGGGLTAVIDRQGEGEWHPSHRASVFIPTEMITGVGPNTQQAKDEFRQVLTLMRRLLGQEMTMGLALPLGEVFEVWGQVFFRVDREVV